MHPALSNHTQMRLHAPAASMLGPPLCVSSPTPLPPCHTTYAAPHLVLAYTLCLLCSYSAYFCPENASRFYDTPFVSSRKFDVGWASGIIGHVISNQSLEFYDRIMSNYTSLIGFEVDFMDFNYLLYNDFVTSLTAAREYDYLLTGSSPSLFCFWPGGAALHALTRN